MLWRYAPRLGRGLPVAQAFQTGDRRCEGAVRLQGFESLRALIPCVDLWE